MKSYKSLVLENKELKARLDESQELVSAIKSGMVDAFVTDDQKVFTLKSADQPYRLFVETMNEGAATLTTDGILIYCNNSFSRIIDVPVEKIVGNSIIKFICRNDVPKINEIISNCKIKTLRKEICFNKNSKESIPVLVSCSSLDSKDNSICMIITDLTEQKQNEKELKNYRDHLETLIAQRSEKLYISEKKFRLAFENAIDAILWADVKTGTIINCNPSAEKLFEKTKKEMVGKNQTNLHPAEDIKNVKNLFHLQSTGTQQPCELRIITKSGKVKVVSISASLIDIGKRRIIQGIFRDITEKKASEELIKRKEADLREAQRIAHIGGWHFDFKTKMVTGSEELYNIFGLDPLKEMFPVFDEQEGVFYPHDDWQKINEEIGKCFKTGIGYEIDVKAIRKKAIIWVTIRSMVVRDRNGNIAGLRGTVQDITERKLYEEALRSSEARFRRLVDNLKGNYFVYSHDKEGIFTYVSETVTRILGYSVSNFKIKYDKYFTDHPVNEKARQHTSKSIEGIKQPSYEVQVKHKDGSKKWLEIQEIPVFDNEGKVLYVEGVAQDITQRKNTLEKLRESEERYRLVIENANSIIMKFDKNFNITFLNNFGLRFFGFKKEEIIGRNALGTIIPEKDDQGQNLWALAEDFIKHPEKYRMNVNQNILKNGKLVWVSWTNKFKFKNNQLVEILSIGSDISQLKKTEEILRDTQAKLSAALASMTDAVFISDNKGMLINLNNAFADFYKFKNKDECPKKFSEYQKFIDVTWSDGTSVPFDMWSVPRALRGEVLTNIEYYLKRKDTKEEWVGNYSFAPIRDDKGVIVGSVVTARDITEIKKAEAALEESRNFLQSIIDNSPNFIYICDLNKKYIIANKAVCDTFGEKLESIVGKRRSEIMDKVIAYQHDLNDQQVVDEKRSIEFEELAYVGGEKLVFLSNKFPLYDNKGNIYAVAGISSDISERKKTENILKHDKETVERLVRLRTRELIEAQEELEKSKRLSDIGVLAATVAHELRNPLAAIQLAAGNIKRKKKNPEIDRHLVSINKKVNESEQIINNLLFYSRLKPPHYEKIKIFDIINECAESLKKQTKKDLTITKNLEAIRDMKIDADPLQMKEVFNNIFNNANDALPQENGRIKVFAENKIKFIKVVVEDNGNGMSEDIVERVFDPFFTTKAKGTGLGLTVCRQIIHFHGGEIKINSIYGEGTSISVFLPIKKN